MALALLHTSPLHVPVFEALRDEDHPGLELRHFVDESLLARARELGPGAVADDVRTALSRAAADGARAVLCTCSTIGAVAEAAASTTGVPGVSDAPGVPGVPVVRGDRPMAAAAVAAGGRIVVLATVESTFAPTAGLIEDEARRAGRSVTVGTLLVEGAWEQFAAGDTQACARLVAYAADSVTDADVIVLAQGSMAPAQHLVRTAVPVLSSPRPGLAAGARAARAG
ncbi:arylsulfatase [Streptomyces soliscabiei]|uniref:arylsulfatase n=1 Tax=Streptomyces soliscabiei TaxID=588897 RepID=UPI0029B8EB2B|nr:arylsulfatase [Streptomyces sp. NY05-11A]MDX2683447.1 arylsulfatase [Streptomyces sp. NY05-11A]